MTATRISVGGDAPYEVVIGTGVLGELASMAGKTAATVAVIHAAGLAGLARSACGVLEDAGLAVHARPVPDGEAAKTIAVAAGLWSWLASARLTRTDAVVSVGGGAVTDLAGFAAATWLRGVRVVHVPTTVLAMVDAAVGGKTAIDIPEGKNLVGAFHPPAGVLCELAALETLPPRDLAAGLAEVIKAGFIADGAILDLVRADPAGARAPRGPRIRELIERGVRVKAEVVSADPREAGRREILNYGHTLGHAIERFEGYRFRHGDAVAIGMVYAAEVARLSGRLSAADVDLHRSILTSVGLPVRYRPPAAWPRLREAMTLDKKSRGARLRMVLLEGIGNPVLDAPDDGLLEQAYQAVAG
jgi:3-dehydroquinate synthase